MTCPVCSRLAAAAVTILERRTGGDVWVTRYTHVLSRVTSGPWVCIKEHPAVPGDFMMTLHCGWTV